MHNCLRSSEGAKGAHVFLIHTEVEQGAVKQSVDVWKTPCLQYMRLRWKPCGNVWIYAASTCGLAASHGKLGFIQPGTVISSRGFFFYLQAL